MQAMQRASHTVELASELRSRAAVPQAHAAIVDVANGEIERLTAAWRANGAPDLFFCYHLYYKAPDFIGPALTREFGIPYVAAEASLSPRHATSPWAQGEASIRETVVRADLLICFTKRDQAGMLRIMPDLPTALLEPFIDFDRFIPPLPKELSSPRLVTVAMMRDGDKLESYRILAEALVKCMDRPWSLTVIGGGEVRPSVEALFAPFEGRIRWLGERTREDIPSLLAQADLYVWPGVGEAFGLAYLEAQAAGLPVVAQAIAGVPEVVRHGETGLLTPPGDVAAYADALSLLMSDGDLRVRMGARARHFVHEERSLAQASGKLQSLLARFQN